MKRARQAPVNDLPLFAKPSAVPAQAAPPRSQPRTPRSPGSDRWRHPRTWTAIAGLLLFFAGVWLMIPVGGDPDLAESRPADRSLPTIVVDAGHGGHDNGAARNGLREKDLTLDTALRLERKLRARGFPVVMTRRDDRFLELAERGDIANRIPRALFISVHFNDNITAAGEGVETYYASEKVSPPQEGWSFAGLFFREKPEAPPADNGLAFATAVQGSVVGALKVTDRGVKVGRYAVIRQTRCPAVLVEGGFINNPKQAKLISRPAYRDKLAEAIAQGVADYQRQRTLELKKPKLAQVVSQPPR
jgi:N-acetylmuramoyl-L-alanine amidase